MKTLVAIALTVVSVSFIAGFGMNVFLYVDAYASSGSCNIVDKFSIGFDIPMVMFIFIMFIYATKKLLEKKEEQNG